MGPLVHNITNYVTVNDVANVLLACGASPIMSDDQEEVEDITSICSGLNINIGTLSQHTIPSMYLAGRKANELNHTVLLDPVGAGASALRTDTALGLMKEIKLSLQKLWKIFCCIIQFSCIRHTQEPWYLGSIRKMYDEWIFSS